jgi:hypothetical protein
MRNLLITVAVLAIGFCFCQPVIAKKVKVEVYIIDNKVSLKEAREIRPDKNWHKKDYHFYPKTILTIGKTDFWDGRFDNTRMEAKKDGVVDAIINPHALPEEIKGDISKFFQEKVKKEVTRMLDQFRQFVIKHHDRLQIENNKKRFWCYYDDDNIKYELEKNCYGIYFEALHSNEPFSGSRKIILINSIGYKDALEDIILLIKRANKEQK